MRSFHQLIKLYDACWQLDTLALGSWDSQLSSHQCFNNFGLRVVQHSPYWGPTGNHYHTNSSNTMCTVELHNNIMVELMTSGCFEPIITMYEHNIIIIACNCRILDTRSQLWTCDNIVCTYMYIFIYQLI